MAKKGKKPPLLAGDWADAARQIRAASNAADIFLANVNEESRCETLLQELWSRAHMPFSAAVWWIALSGVAGEPDDEALEEAARRLVKALGDKEIQVHGRANAAAVHSELPAELFRYFKNFITSDASLDSIGGQRYDLEGKGDGLRNPEFLFNFCLVDDGDDRLENNRGVIFSEITVSRESLLKLWPAKVAYESRQPLQDAAVDLLAVANQIAAEGETDGKRAFAKAKSRGIMCTRNNFLDAWRQTPNGGKQGPKGPRTNYPKQPG